MSRILVSLASSHDNTDRATVGIVVAGAAAAPGQDSTVFLSADGAWLGEKGEADKIHETGSPRWPNCWPASSTQEARSSCAARVRRSAGSPRPTSFPAPSSRAAPLSP